MKKEYFILVLIIIALSAYLFFHNRNKANYTLPEFPDIDASDITRIHIDQPKKTIELFKVNDNWVVTDDKYPCDEGVINEMVNNIATLEVTALISESGHLARYDLTEDTKIKVTAKNKDKTLREFTVGKTAPTYKHTFITLENPKYVYHAKNNLNRLFNKTIDNLRDKQIQKINKSDIEEISVEKQDMIRTFTREKEKENEGNPHWESTDKEPVDQDAIAAIVDQLSDLTCSGFDEKTTRSDLVNSNRIVKISVTASENYEFALFDKINADKYKGISSNSPYVFFLEDYVSDDIVTNTDKVLNIKNEGDDGEDS